MATSSCRPREGKEAKRRRWRKKRAAFEEAPRLADAKRLGIGRCDGVCGLHSIVEQYIDELNALPSPRGVRIASQDKNGELTAIAALPSPRGERGEAPPVAEEASRFRGSTPIGRREAAVNRQVRRCLRIASSQRHGP